MDKKTKHLSGSNKRKLAAEKKRVAAGRDPKQQKLAGFFNKSSDKPKDDYISDSSDTSESDGSVIAPCEKEKQTEQVSDSEIQAEQVDLAVSDECRDIDKGQDNLFSFLGQNASVAEKVSFVNQHPFQPDKREALNLTADISKIYFRVLPNGDRVQRNWITAKVVNKTLISFHCSICLAFGNDPSCNFIQGVSDRLPQRAKDHEDTHLHRDSVGAYLAAKNCKYVSHLLNGEVLSLRKKQIEANLGVLKIIFDIIKLIARQTLPYRAHGTNESLYNLRNPSLNHGNFLEIVKTFAEHNALLGQHLDQAIKKSSARKEQQEKTGEKSKGRGALVTFLSKTFVNQVIEAIVNELKLLIVGEISTKKFSVQMDSITDITGTDQVAIVLRYVSNTTVKERLFAIVQARSSTGTIYKIIYYFSFIVYY